MTVALAACGGAAPSPDSGPVELGGDAVIYWPRQADHVVFQIDVVGGDEAAFERRNDIPLCTIYGDNRIVWTDGSGSGRTQVLFDALDDVTIYTFVSDLSVNYRLYTYESLRDTQLLTEDAPPVYEQIRLNVNDREHTTDNFAAWPSGFFQDILADCRSLSQAPALFEPSGGWLSAAFAEYDPDAPVITWSAEVSGVSLSALADAERRLWVDNTNLPILWNIVTNSPRSRLADDGGAYVRLAFEVPNVHRTAPPAPSPDELEAARTPSELIDEATETE